MSSTRRIMIADGNRYQAMLVERELHNKLGQCKCTVLKDSDKVLNELGRVPYSTALIDTEMKLKSGNSLYLEVQESHPELPLLLLRSPAVTSELRDKQRPPHVSIIEKDSTFHITIPEQLGFFLEHGSFPEKTRRQKPRLTARRKADMINITAGTLSHEINNPLMAILGVSELIVKGKGEELNPDIRLKIEMIRKSAQRIEKVLEQLQSLSEPTILSTAAGNLISTAIDHVSPSQAKE